MEEINEELKEYIEKNVLPLYVNNDYGHGLEHINYVLNRCFEFSSQFDNLDKNILYIIAVYHGVGHYIDKDNHEVFSSKMFYENEDMKKFFNNEERTIIKEAIEDHRASSKKIPRNDYGKILSSSDRTTNIDIVMKRTYAYILKHHPEYTIEEMINTAYKHIKKKYGESGYAKCFVIDLEFEKFKKDIKELLEDKKLFVKKYIEINNLVNSEENIYLKDVIFQNSDYYSKLKVLHLEKEKLKLMRELCNQIKPYVIEFTGTPRTGKTTMINNIYDFFKKGGFKVSLLEEFTTSKYYNDIFKKIFNSMSVADGNIAIIDEVYNQLLGSLENNDDILLIDRSLNDRQIWNYRKYILGEMTREQYELSKNKYKAISNDLIDLLVITYADPITCLKRDYNSGLSLEERRFLKEKNIKEFNDSLIALKPFLSTCVDEDIFLDTTNMSIQDSSLQVASKVLSSFERKLVIK